MSKMIEDNIFITIIGTRCVYQGKNDEATQNCCLVLRSNSLLLLTWTTVAIGGLDGHCDRSQRRARHGGWRRAIRLSLLQDLCACGLGKGSGDDRFRPSQLQ